MKKIVITLALVLLFLITGCSNHAEDKTHQAQVEDKIAVYYVKGNDYYDEALAAFKRTNKEITVELTAFETDEDLAKKYAAEGLSDQGADVVLLSTGLDIDLQKIIQVDKCLDITSFVEAGGIYEGDAYSDEVLKAGMVDGKQYVLPFTYDLGLVLGRTSVYDLSDTNFDKSSDFNSFAEILLKAQEDLYDSEEIRLGLHLDVPSVEDSLMYMYRISGLELTDGRALTANKDDVKKVCDLSRAIQQEFEVKFEELVNSGSNSAKLIGYMIMYGNPASIVRKNEFSYELETGEEIEFDGIYSTDACYHATVRDCGFINANSTNPNIAYKLLKFILDYNYNGLMVSGDTMGTPVNKENFLAQLDMMKEWESVSAGGAQVPILKMREAHYDKVQEMIDNISEASLINREIETIFTETMGEYVNGTKDFEDCYKQMESRMNIYLKE